MRKILAYILLIFTAYTAMAQVYRVGDVYTAPDGSQGIVFHLHPDGSGGWVVALNDASAGCPWGTEDDVPGLVNSSTVYSNVSYLFQQMLCETAGYENTRVLREFQNNNPAYAAGMVDFEHGWYLPAPGQLSKLYSQMPFISSAILEAGGTLLSSGLYWTTAEYSTIVWCVHFGHGQFDRANKRNNCRVRAIRSFTYESSYEWSTGSTEAVITVSPEQTTEYSVTVTASTGCTGVEQHTIVVNMPDSVEVAKTVCDSYEWNGQTYSESGNYTQTLVNQYGCDSVVTLHLTVRYGTHNVTDTTVCESFTWTGGSGETYTVSGTYIYDYTNRDGCPSADTLHLTVNYGTHNVTDTTVCESFTWTGGSGETYSVSGTYTYDYTNSDGCPSVDTLHLTVNYGTHNVTDTTVCESFTWTGGTGETYTVSGTYIYDYTNSDGCFSADTLHLTVYYGTHNVTDTTVCESFTWAGGTGETYTVSGTYTYDYTNSDGCPSADTLHLTVNYGTHNVTDTTVCESFTWTGGSGETYSVSGTYIYDYTNSDGCPSADTLHLTVNYGTHNVTDTTVCESFTWTGGSGETYTVSGTYTYDYTNSDGCPSTDTLHLTVHYGTHNVTDTTVCESFTWAGGTGETYTVSGTYTYDYTNSDGCPSADTLHLTVNYGTHYVTDTTVCESFTWTGGSGETYSVSGTYIYDYTNRDGCPSVDTLHLTVNYGTHNVTDTTVCESYTWAGGTGETYTVSGTYTYDYTNRDGCPSADTLHLTVNHGMHQSETVVGYDSYDWNGHTYTQSGDYTYIHTDENGCEQVDTLHLTLFSSSEEEFSAVACESYIWNDSVYTASGDYVQAFLDIHSADSVVTLHLTVNYGTHNVTDTTVCESFTWAGGSGETYTVSGTYTYDYTNSDGCFSADTLHLTVNYSTHNVTDTTVCESYTWTDGTGETYTVSGIYVFDYTNAEGCESADTLHLTVHYGTHNVTDITVCESYTWTDGTGETYTVSGTYLYDYSNSDGCPGTDTLHLTVNYGTHNVTDTTVCESFTWENGTGETYTVSGTYTYDYTNSDGCFSTDTLHLTVYYGTHNVTDTTVCENFTWTDGTGETYSESGTYLYDYTNSGGCPSTDTLQLTVNRPQPQSETAVGYDSYEWNGHIYTQSGNYTYSHTDVNGCEQVDTLHLTLYFTSFSEFAEVVCESYIWNDSVYTVSGDYVQTFLTIHGADSVVTLHLTVHHETHNVTDTAVCENFTWADGTGETYDDSGTYIFDYTNAEGCESADTLHLTVYRGTHNVTDTTACESFTWTGGTGETYTVSGAYIFDYTNAEGCESADTLHLIVNHGTHNVTDTTVCESFTWVDGTGETYDVSGTYIFDYTNAEGCESADTLRLLVNHGTHNVTDTTVCESYTWTDGTGETYTVSGTYIFDYTISDDCPNTDTLYLTVNHAVSERVETTVCKDDFPFVWNGLTFTEDATQSVVLQSSNGCDSIVTMVLNSIDDDFRIVMLTEDPCEDFTADLLAQTGMTNFIWSTGETTPQITVTHSGTYYVTASEGNCIVTDNIFVPVCDFQLYLPNAITASDNNGINDYFFIPQYSQRQISDFEIVIYNRWGQMVFRSEDKNFRWHGDSNGKIMANTTYTYVIHCTNYNGQKFIFKGIVTVL